jgi:hypothetical protein
MFRALCVATAVCAVASVARADVMQFPYEAVVQGDDVHVRSGPGKNYYATSQLTRNDRVTVVRHDPGGWFMIVPPEGSVSWVESKLVDRTGNRGTINVPPGDAGLPGQAVVRIGSTLSDDHSLTGRQLHSGDDVSILGEKTLQSENGPVKMLQIVPPPREYRWVKGTFIVPVDASLRHQLDHDPFVTPSAHRVPEKAPLAEATEEESEPPAPLPRLRTPEIPVLSKKVDDSETLVESLPADRQQLADIDNRYADMMILDMSQWRLGELRSAYESLKSSAPNLTRQIDLRLGALEGREKIYERYAKFVAITSQTDLRDAQLSNGQGIMQVSNEAPGVDLGQAADSPPALPEANQAALKEMLNIPQTSISQTPAAQASTPSLPALPAAVPQDAKLDGAGIIRSTPANIAGVPKHMLVAADGRFLAYVQSSSVNLDQYVGQSLGLFGKRGKDARLQADLIEVERLMPVQISR